MPSIQALRSDTTVVAFDVYDTLLDRDATLLPALKPLLDSASTDPLVFLRRYLAKHFRDSLIDSLIPGPHTPFKVISRRALIYRLEQAGLTYDDAAVTRVIDAWTRLEPYDAVATALERLGESYTLVGLSNGDPDMLAAVEPNLEVELDAVISVARAGAYKPHPDPYRRVLARYDIAAHEAVFVTAHTFDLVGAKAIGMRGAYLDRHDNPFGGWPHRPDIRVDTAPELADTLS